MIPLVDLVAQIQSIRPDLDEAIGGVVSRACFVLGCSLERFEQAFADYVGVKHCVGVQSGTAALHVALLAAGVGAGDEVITAPSSFFATAEAISLAGARPVFADVEADTLNLDPAKLEAAITPRTKGIIPVHLFGQAADMRPIQTIADRRGLLVIEDACQAHGTTYEGRRCGGLGLGGAFSFYPGKNLGAFGEGGAITTNDDALAAKSRLLRNHGSPEKYRHTLVGLNYRLDDIQSAVLEVKLRHLDDWNERRRQLAARYRDCLAGVGDLEIVAERAYGKPVYHLFVVRSPHHERIFDRFAKRDISRAVHYPIPIHLQDAYKDLGYGPGSFPVAEAAAREVLSLPLYPELTGAQQDQVVEAIAEAFR